MAILIFGYVFFAVLCLSYIDNTGFFEQIMGCNGPPRPADRPSPPGSSMICIASVSKPEKVRYTPIREREPNMKEKIKKRVLWDLLTSPISLIPVASGLTGIILSWPLSSPLLLGLGIITSAVGVGILITRLLTSLPKIADKALAKELASIERENEIALNNLEKQLRQDKDPRPEQCLQQLRLLQKIVKNEGGGFLSDQIAIQFNKLFDVCIKKIEETDTLWRQGRELTGKAKKQIKERREKIVVEIETTTNQLMTSIEQFKTAKSHESDAEFIEARDELNRTMEIARKVDERLNFGEYDQRDFLELEDKEQ